MILNLERDANLKIQFFFVFTQQILELESFWLFAGVSFLNKSGTADKKTSRLNAFYIK